MVVHRRAVFSFNLLAGVSASQAAAFVRSWAALAARCADLIDTAVQVKEKARDAACLAELVGSQKGE